MNNQKLLSKATEQNIYLRGMYSTLAGKGINPNDNSAYQFERAILIGMTKMLDVVGVDRSQFNWIF